nr:4.8 kDa non-structural protein [Bovine coronavirus]UVC33070.1 4.8 kDa non-structural protein [Bovine coronavirus]UVC33142.1 4.8 kDa non-structural protein [Bovine coronavirus]UVC33166.1 4.8 kDa non-structural protein [Bovine coronavirus]UVC33226.1 4.8 kDa non-structural protein [Bovine coronavirus]
MPMAITI